MCGGRGDQLGARAGQLIGDAPGVGDLEGHPQPRADPAPDLHPVDHVDLLRAGELERRTAHVEDGDPLAVVAVQLELLGPAQHIAVETHRFLVIIGLDDQTHLKDAACGRRHRAVGR